MFLKYICVLVCLIPFCEVVSEMAAETVTETNTETVTETVNVMSKETAEKRRIEIESDQLQLLHSTPEAAFFLEGCTGLYNAVRFKKFLILILFVFKTRSNHMSTQQIKNILLNIFAMSNFITNKQTNKHERSAGGGERMLTYTVFN